VDYQILPAQPHDRAAIQEFLREHQDFTLFLRSNLQQHGLRLSSEPNSGNYKCIWQNDQIVGVFALFRRGTLIVQAPNDEQLFAPILASTLEEPVELGGVVGDWRFCGPFWSYLRRQGVVQEEGFVSKEVLYRANLDQCHFSVDPRFTVLRAEHFDQWFAHRKRYVEEMGLPSRLSQEEVYDDYLRKSEAGVIWAMMEGQKILSMAELNAHVEEAGQLGGVFTPKPLRGQGYAKVLCQQILRSCREQLGMQTLIIFTGETNTSAQKVYEALGVQRRGFFALLFKR